jgi:hypothetical protein
MDEIAMSFERTTHLCYHMIKLNDAVRNRNKIDVNDICLGTGANCKFGVNKTTEMVCTQDFLTGTCSCPTKEYVTTKNSELKLALEQLNKQLEEVKSIEQLDITTTNRYEFTTISKPKNKKAIEKLKFRIQEQHNSATAELKQLETCRMIHYTDSGMIPFEKQLALYNDIKLEEARMLAVKLQSLDDLIKVTQSAKPIVTLGKLGKKK